MKIFLITIVTMFILLCVSCSKNNNEKISTGKEQIAEDVTFTDIEGNVYKTVKIGNQTWMAENLRVTSTPDGNKLDDVFAYEDDEKNVNIYGRLYTWDAVLAACPKGWRLPTKEDWTKLIDFLGGHEKAGGKLKKIQYWEEPNLGATNEVGFNAVAGGFRGPVGEYHGLYYELNRHCDFWGKTIEEQPWSICIYHDFEEIKLMDDNDKTIGFSVRYIKDEF